MKLDRKLFKNFDYRITLSMFAIIAIGIVTISSATKVFTETGDHRKFYIQILWMIISCVIAFFILLIDYNTIGGYYKILYLGSNLLLVAVLIFGREVNGAKSWLGVGPQQIQPSEFAKLIIIITLAKVMEEMDNINTFKNLSKIAIICLIPMGLIQLQPDFGTNLIFAITIVGMIFVAGLDLRFIYGSIIAAVIGIAAVWNLNILQPYQRDRILVFLRPEMDRLGRGYNAIIAKTAIGSGQFFGMGLYNGIQTTGNFIPESSTDFIFSVFAEEWGFLGAAILLGLYLNIILKSVGIAKTSKDKFGKYLIVGIVTMLTFQILQNIGMDLGLMPITGIPLPFMSYGGSSLLTNIISIALIVNVGMRRQKINF
jgi:rod shape determining protein RodA